ncbi:hypothetical protein J3U66_10800 [Gilliamella sp. B2969]|uniref:hypothetical protein n=1 Tax=unclassified Gilliamella TaxID=2685620 RepID=UPI002269EA51|nr:MULTISPECIES: hypothetical protein [unclassified Gilliamella]MCX8727964.1 hypothetical protein [Gilliamella sp. B2838]MCX8730866.1 hypothetical protein [Gilliamella sp. B2969]
MKKIVSSLCIAVFCCFTLCNTHMVFANNNALNYNQREHFDSFADFYQSLPILSMPIDSKNISTGKYVDSKFFHFDDDDYRYYDKPTVQTDNYFTLTDLKAIGRFEMDDIKFILYDLTFDSIGEGINEDIKLINAFDKNGKFLDELMIAGKTGHEDHLFFFSSTIKDQLFHIKLDAVYELGYVAEVKDNIYQYKQTINLTYQFHDNQFYLQAPPVNCQTKNLKQYLNKLTKQQFADVADIVAFSNYIDCYPVSENLQTYKQIANYIKNSIHYFLSSAELKTLQKKIGIIED